MLFSLERSEPNGNVAHTIKCFMELCQVVWQEKLMLEQKDTGLARSMVISVPAASEEWLSHYSRKVTVYIAM